ncbi:NAD(P)H-binding protein [Nocardia terrae]|nr:NAD(P)H-binding protein [Nocardia terrae]
MGKTYVVCGASGRVGLLVAQHLLAQGHRVRAVTRDPSRLDWLAAQGAQVCGGSIQDPGFLTEVMRGADAAFVLTPVDTTQQDVNRVQRRVIDATTTGIRESGVGHVVLLSSWGAELAEPVGGIIACHWFEEKLNTIDGLNVVHLRPVWFMENFLWNIGLIKTAGINGSVVAPHTSFPMIATPDIASVAADYLGSLSFEGRSVRYLNGARDYTLVEATRILGAAIDRPGLRYSRMPQVVLEKGMVDSGGLTPGAAEFVTEIGLGISSRLVHAEPRSAANTTPTTLETFAGEVFAPAYHAAPDAPLRARVGGAALRAMLTAIGRRPV